MRNQRKKSVEQIPLQEGLYSITEAINDYDEKNMKDKKFYEIEAFILGDKIEKTLLGIYSLYQRLNTDTGLDLRLKISKAKINEKVANIMQTRQDFRIICLKYLTSFLQNNELKQISDIGLMLDVQFMGQLVALLAEDDFYYVCYSLNCIGKIMKSQAKRKANMSPDSLVKLIQSVLTANEEVGENRAQIVAVKYYVFNQLLEQIGSDQWAQFAFTWISFTCRILNQGLVRQKKSVEFEKWLQKNSKVQNSVITEHCPKLIQLAEEPGVCFFLLYVLCLHKSDLMNGGLRDIVQRALRATRQAAVDYLVADYEWIMTNVLNKGLKNLILSEARESDPSFLKENPLIAAKINSFLQRYKGK
jgi:hypothetical protein